MMSIHPYLTFNGNCREAFEFYSAVFGGEFSSISTFAEMPPDDRFTITDADKKRIMHVALPIGRSSVLMASDQLASSPAYTPGNNFSISIHLENPVKAEQIFKSLSVNGQITMNLEATFWDALFGMLVDQFGIKWMINCKLTDQT